MIEGSAELVHNRNAFYRDSYQKVLLALLVIIAINLALVGVLYYQLTHRPAPKYFAISADKRLAKLLPLSVPIMGPDAILAWANRAAVAAHSYNFVNWRAALQRAQNNFTSNKFSLIRQLIASIFF